ncbi:SIS domain-containing protein [Allofustis seminis]|uniref:SIS domain-containing protein n=1 Tax=Allofustis seminis TaxID=166939 RepID=UPI00037524EE|nr:SIS domain-containing protein [Allofustis seminis]
MKNFINEYNKEFIQVIQALDDQKMIELYQLLEEAISNERNVFIMGNGGSSASASHWVCDFNKGINYHYFPRIKMYSLSDNTPIFSALGNDFSYDDVFIEQLKNYLTPDDLVIGLSVSGNSKNIVKALKYANESNAKTYAIIGDYDGEMGDISDHVLYVPSQNYGIVEDIHMYICHVLSQYMLKVRKG